MGGEGGGEGREILLLFKCPLSGSVYDLGAVSRRHSGSGRAYCMADPHFTVTTAILCLVEVVL